MSVMAFNPWQALRQQSKPIDLRGHTEAIEAPLAKLAVLSASDAEIAKRDEAAERAAIQSEPPIPAIGTDERAIIDQKQTELCQGLLRAFKSNRTPQRGE